MGLNFKSERLRGWRDKLHIKSERLRPNFETSIQLLTFILAEVYSPKNVNYVKRELAKVVAANPDLTEHQLKLYNSLTAKIDAKFTLIQERAERRRAKKTAAKAEKKVVVATPAPIDTSDPFYAGGN